MEVFQTLIDVHAISKHYRKRHSRDRVQAVRDVSFRVNRGEILGLLGPNGAGKTTTIKMICGLIRPDGGVIRVNGFDIQRERSRAMQHISAVLEGNRNLYWRLSVQENLEYFAGNRGHSRRSIQGSIDTLLTQFNLGDKRKELVNNLSRGMQQKLAIAVAMLAGTEAILLDEPTLGLDVETGYEVRELLRTVADQGRTIIISSHDMPVVQDLCSRTVIISAGEVVVDDKVSNLLELFSSKAYAISLGSPLSTRQMLALREAFSMLSIAADQQSLTVTLEHEDKLYLLIDILKSERSLIESIDRSNINFESVFRKIVNGQTEVQHALA